MSLYLSHDELRELTGRTRHSAQARALRHMGVTHKIRPDGRVIVLRSHLAAILDGKSADKSKPTEPDWSALDA